MKEFWNYVQMVFTALCGRLAPHRWQTAHEPNSRKGNCHSGSISILRTYMKIRHSPRLPYLSVRQIGIC